MKSTMKIVLGALLATASLAYAHEVDIQPFMLDKAVVKTYDRLEKEHRTGELSKDFLEVYNGVKKGNYSYELGVIEKVIIELSRINMPTTR